MESRRVKLHQELVDILGTSHVYYDPPESIKMVYPCIIYERESGHSDYADNSTYRYTQSYQVTYVNHAVENDVCKKLLDHFQMIRYSRHFVADNLHHDVFYLYF